MCRLDGLIDDEGNFAAQEEVEALVPSLAAALQVSPQRDIISAADLEAWVGSLAPEDRQALAMRHAGSTLGDIADYLESASRTSSRG